MEPMVIYLLAQYLQVQMSLLQKIMN